MYYEKESKVRNFLFYTKFRYKVLFYFNVSDLPTFKIKQGYTYPNLIVFKINYQFPNCSDHCFHT